MSESCAKYRPVLGRWVEGETSPGEAFQLAQHLQDCTACRIVLAREIRLARVLDRLNDSIAVEEGFLRTVMRSLPNGPPPATRRNRGLKLAGLGGALVLTGMSAWRLAWLLAGEPWAGSLPRLRIPHVENLLETLGGVSGVVWAALDRVSASALFEVPFLHVDPRICLAALLPVVIAVLTASTLAVVITRARCRG